MMPQRNEKSTKNSQDSRDRVASINNTILDLQRKAELRRIVNVTEKSSSKSLREEFLEDINISR